MNPYRPACLLVGVIAVTSLSAAAADTSVADRMRQYVEQKEIAGAVTLVASRDEVLDIQAVGMADVEKNEAMRPDAIFWIASMTTPITATAVMMLQDEGKLSVEDPVGKYIPELANLKTKDGKPANVTLRHLLTHTSGMGEATSSQMRAAKSLADLIPVYAAQPVKFQPGSKWEYCQSGINLLGRIVEIVSGQNLEEFFQARLFRPLGMKDTTFYPTESQLPRIARSYSRTGAEAILRRNRCTKGSDGIYTCPSVGKLSFRFTSTAGNQLRELAFEVIQSQLKAVGIEVKSAFGPASHVFGTVLPSRDWDLFMFTWIGSPTSPMTDDDIHGCGGDQNDMEYCNQRVTRLLKQAKTTVNDRRRNALLNQADALMANDIPQIPLFARPGFLISEKRIQGILRNPTQQTALWNVNKWWSTSR